MFEEIYIFIYILILFLTKRTYIHMGYTLQKSNLILFKVLNFLIDLTDDAIK